MSDTNDVPPGDDSGNAVPPGDVPPSGVPAGAGPPNRTPLIVAAVALVAIVAIALAATLRSDDDTEVTGIGSPASSTTSANSTNSTNSAGGSPSSTANGGTPAAGAPGGSVEVTGASLPTADGTGLVVDDPAAGKTIPTLVGFDVDGAPMTIEPGHAQLIVVMAHWCPHCQREIPRLVGWIDDGTTKGVDVVGVSTATDQARGNYPPASWLEREEWTQPTLQDDRSVTALDALGVSSFPTLIAVDAEGKVTGRYLGEAEQSDVKDLVDAALGP